MGVHSATKDYEAWLSTHFKLVEPALKKKHEQMAKGSYLFLRGTFYLWVKRWLERCADLAGAPEVQCVGDLHIENFGTWRDGEGRLAWGVNDFDEACPGPYTQDLVRLATSVILANEEGDLAIKGDEASEAILEGYIEGVTTGGRPFVLAERHGWLRELATGEMRDPEVFWDKLLSLPGVHGEIAPEAIRTIEAMLPEPGLVYECHARMAGMGSLGVPRVVAVADWRGGHVAREAKVLVPSAHAWVTGGRAVSHYREILERAVRVPDPLVRVVNGWVVRRLAPDCFKVELENLPLKRDEMRLLEAMGRETANIHLGSGQGAQAVHEDLRNRRDGWLLDAARRMAETVAGDAKRWRGE